MEGLDLSDYTGGEAIKALQKAIDANIPPPPNCDCRICTEVKTFYDMINDSDNMWTEPFVNDEGEEDVRIMTTFTQEDIDVWTKKAD